MTTPWTVSPARATDRSSVQQLFRACSTASVVGRFFAPVRRFPVGYLDGALAGRPAVHDAAVVRYGDGAHLAALASLVRADVAGPPAAELGVLVADRWQRQGLGRALVDYLAARAVERDVEVLIATVLPGRSALLQSLTAIGPLLSISAESDGVTGRFALSPASG